MSPPRPVLVFQELPCCRVPCRVVSLSVLRRHIHIHTIIHTHTQCEKEDMADIQTYGTHSQPSQGFYYCLGQLMVHTKFIPSPPTINPKACYNNKIEVTILKATCKAITNPNYPSPFLRIKPSF